MLLFISDVKMAVILILLAEVSSPATEYYRDIYSVTAISINTYHDQI
jgi:hypothetical protein